MPLRIYQDLTTQRGTKGVSHLRCNIMDLASENPTQNYRLVTTRTFILSVLTLVEKEDVILRLSQNVLSNLFRID